MPEFSAETYTPGTAAPRARDLALAAHQVTQPQAPVRFPDAVVVPNQETCLICRWVHADDGALVMN